jgi:hypothetical protein
MKVFLFVISCFSSVVIASENIVKSFTDEVLYLAKDFNSEDKTRYKQLLFNVISHYFNPLPLVQHLTPESSLHIKFCEVLKKKIAYLCLNALPTVKGAQVRITSQTYREGFTRFICKIRKGTEVSMTIVVIGKESGNKILVKDVVFEGISAYQSIKMDIQTGCQGKPHKNQCVNNNIIKLFKSYNIS